MSVSRSHDTACYASQGSSRYFETKQRNMTRRGEERAASHLESPDASFAVSPRERGRADGYLCQSCLERALALIPLPAMSALFAAGCRRRTPGPRRLGCHSVLRTRNAVTAKSKIISSSKSKKEKAAKAKIVEAARVGTAES